METPSLNTFLDYWHFSMIIGAVIMTIVAIIVYLAYHVRVSMIREYKDRYDFINTKEIATYKGVFLCLGIAVMLAINLYGMGKLRDIGVWFFVRLFMSMAGGTLVTYVAFLVLEYYYPTILNKKLRKWRYTPRIGKSGNKLRLLGEEEEDVHLEEGMLAEENVFSIDYDVWVDERSGDVKIEKYPGHLQAMKCNSCGFYTMKVVREEVVREPSKDSPGELIKHYQCYYCKSVRATAFNISTKAVDDYKHAKRYSFKSNKNIDMVRVEIHSSLGGKKFYEFQNIGQAQKFLDEYDSDKPA
ncbi:MAG: hypothetical protein OEV74_09495 [Cyclobacteriaceae bacterium]|nr:hypothetical protein [Cyclobacteriaceae bacterium]MDH4296502.1 hypothetical protein [Cyclobacteriaceae bacterium]MDH5249273.1 hypothetical protein [Cyclobacteriaceae bacterium]